jgi:hypothetical protein
MKYKITIDGVEKYLSSFEVDLMVSKDYVKFRYDHYESHDDSVDMVCKKFNLKRELVEHMVLN